MVNIFDYDSTIVVNKKELIKEEVINKLNILNKNERNVICLRLGINTKRHTYEQISNILNISHRNVIRIENIALKKIRNSKLLL